MKHLILSIVLLWGCNTISNSNAENNFYKERHNVTYKGDFEQIEIYIVEIDSCEWIVTKYIGYSANTVHKNDCKFCKQRKH